MHENEPELLSRAVEQSRRLIGELESRAQDLQILEGRLALAHALEAACRVDDALVRASSNREHS